MKYILIIIINFFCCSIIYAETIVGSSKVSSSPNKDVIIILYDGVTVDCSKLEQGWYKIIIQVKVAEDNFKNHKSLKKGDKLFDLDNREIGVVIQDLPIEISSIWSTGKTFGIDIYCCINQSCIDPKSIVENQVAAVIRNNPSLAYDSFKSIIKDFKFNLADNLKDKYPKLTEYRILDNYYDAPGDRLRLIFENSKLIAIVFTRELGIKSGKVYHLVDDKKILILSQLSDINQNEFIESNIRSYDLRGRD
jgi:hypothetical protein